jgi:hypothetical protein
LQLLITHVVTSNVLHNQLISIQKAKSALTIVKDNQQLKKVDGIRDIQADLLLLTTEPYQSKWI